MSKLVYKIGDILVNELRQCAKIINVKNGIYGLSGWTTQGNAAKAKIAEKHLNIYGLEYLNYKVIKSGPKAKTTAPEVAEGDEKADAKAEAAADEKKDAESKK